jgi:hypothetical protein
MMIVYWSTFPVLIVVYAAVFLGLPVFAWYLVPQRGWAKPIPAFLLGAVFLGAWAYLNIRGGWVLRVKPPAPGRWSFGVYDVALSADVLFFCAGLWLICNAEARKHIVRTMWFVIPMLAILPLSFYGQFGINIAVPTIKPQIVFPWGTLIAVGIGLVAFYWGRFSGFETEELKDIVANAAHIAPGEAAAVRGPAVEDAGGGPGERH